MIRDFTIQAHSRALRLYDAYENYEVFGGDRDKKGTV